MAVVCCADTSDGSEVVRVVPVQLIHSALHTRRAEDGSLLFVPVEGRSRMVQFGICKT